jgi:hypothetical protein
MVTAISVGFNHDVSQTFAKCRGRGGVAFEAECPHVGKIALAAAFRDRQNVIGVPERFPAAFAEPPGFEKLAAGGVVELAQITPKGSRVDSARSANAAIPIENFLPQITGIGAQLPFVHAGFRAECAAAFRDFASAPAAEPVDLGRRGPAAFFRARHFGRIRPKLRKAFSA